MPQKSISSNWLYLLQKFFFFCFIIFLFYFKENNENRVGSYQATNVKSSTHIHNMTQLLYGIQFHLVPEKGPSGQI